MPYTWSSEDLLFMMFQIINQMQDQIQSKQVRSFDGTNIYYEMLTGQQNLPTLVLIHGVGGTLSAWNAERDYFHNIGYPVLAMDLRGHGKSDDPDPIEAYSFDSFAQDINAVIAAENIVNPVIVGHSFGGMVSIVREGKFPNPRSHRLVLVETSYYMPGIGGLDLSNRLAQKLSKFIASHTSSGVLEQEPDYASFIGSTDYYLPRLLFDIRNTSLHSFFATYEHIFEFKGEDLLGNISAPTLIISGNNDSIFPPRIEEQLAHRIKNSYLESIDGNHIAVISNAADVASHIHAFLTSN